MNSTYLILRILASVLLCGMVLVGFVSFTLSNNLSEKLLNPTFYKTTISAEGTYTRIHSDVLPEIGLGIQTTAILDEVQAITSHDITYLLQELITPDYIQKQVEESINQIIGYINNDKAVLEVYIDLDEPLNNVKAVMFTLIDEKIDKLKLENTGKVDCSQTGLSYLSARYLNEFNSLSKGKIPFAIPSLHSIEPACRRFLFDNSYAFLVGAANLDSETIQNLRENRDRMRALFISGETRNMLKVTSRILSEALMDRGINTFRKELVSGNRLDVIHQMDEWYPTLTESQIRNDILDLKAFISKVTTLGVLGSLTVVIVGTSLMGLVFLPYLSNMLRWPGLALIITGMFCFLTAKIAEHEVPNQLELLINSKSTQISGIPDSVIDISSDVLLLFGTRLTYGMTHPALTLLIVGGFLLGASFFTNKFSRLIPLFNKRY